jgi:hypothetical protein
VAEELAEGLFRAIFALLRGIAGFIIEILRDVVAELILRGLARLFVAFAQGIGALIRFALWVVEALLFLVLRRPVGKRTALVHAMAIGVLMAAGFWIGATASVVYHADWGASDLVATTDVER